MKKMFLFSLVSSFFLIASSANASILNGGFEDGLNDWDIHLFCTTETSHTLFDGTELMPVEGSHFAVVDGDNSLPSSTLAQYFNLEAGSVISGSVALEIRTYYDNEPINTFAKVLISQNFGEDRPTWEVLNLNKTDMSNYIYIPEQHEGKGYVLWTPWQWTAPLTGEYIIRLGTHGSVYYDNFIHGFFDNIKISAGPSFCEGDFEPYDGDVDGSDLAALVANPDLLELSTFAAEFGRIDCLLVE